MIYNYEILNPVPIKGKPGYNNKGDFIVPNIKTSYRWYLEAARNNLETCDREYFLLFGDTKFDYSCKRIFWSNGKANVAISGEFKDFVDKEIKYRGGVELEYYESEQDFDSWRIY